MSHSVPRSSVLDRLVRGGVLRITKHAPDHFTAVVEERNDWQGATETEIDPLTAFRVAGYAGVECVADHGAEKAYAWVGVLPSGDGQGTEPPVLAHPQPASKPASSRTASSRSASFRSGGLSLSEVMDAAERLAARFSTPRLPCEVVGVRREGVAFVVRVRGPELARLGVADGLSGEYGREVIAEAVAGTS